MVHHREQLLGTRRLVAQQLLRVALVMLPDALQVLVQRVERRRDLQTRAFIGERVEVRAGRHAQRVVGDLVGAAASRDRLLELGNVGRLDLVELLGAGDVGLVETLDGAVLQLHAGEDRVDAFAEVLQFLAGERRSRLADRFVTRTRSLRLVRIGKPLGTRRRRAGDHDQRTDGGDQQRTQMQKALVGRHVRRRSILHTAGGPVASIHLGGCPAIQSTGKIALDRVRNRPRPADRQPAGCCCVTQWKAPRPHTRSVASMPSTCRDGKQRPSVASARASLACPKTGTSTTSLAT